jgi:phospholipase C
MTSSYLATQFAVCDGWFASGPVQTLANRVFTHCGTPGRVPGTNDARINNPDFTDGLIKNRKPTVTDKTIFELLDETYPGQINWKVYYHDAPLSALCTYVYDHWDVMTWDSGNVYHFRQTLSNETNLEYDIKNNRLPRYSFIEPRYESNISGGTVNSFHPGGAGIDIADPNGDSLPPPISVLNGERFLKEVYEILAKYPETFKKTLLVVIYDEHGGLFDHVKPPTAPSPFVRPVANFSYDRYGVRIPALLINPCIPPGTIYPPRDKSAGTHFDHTSLIATICAQFGLEGRLTPRSDKATLLLNLIPDKPQVHTRPAPPSLPPAEPKDETVAPPAEMNVAAAMAVIRAQKVPHALAGALVPLLAIEQQRRK